MPQVKLPVVDRLHPQRNRCAMGAENEVIGDLNSPEGCIHILGMRLMQEEYH